MRKYLFALLLLASASASAQQEREGAAAKPQPTEKQGAQSTEKQGAQSTEKKGAQSTEKQGAQSTEEKGAQSTEKQGAQSTEEPTMAALFKAMPDSLMPYLTKNNRLDMIDFMEANMKAEITNQLEGRTEMTALTADSLSLRMNETLRIDMKKVQVQTPVDSSLFVIQVWRNYQINEHQTEQIVDVYSSAWRLKESRLERSTLLKRDEDLKELPQF